MRVSDETQVDVNWDAYLMAWVDLDSHGARVLMHDERCIEPARGDEGGEG